MKSVNDMEKENLVSGTKTIPTDSIFRDENLPSPTFVSKSKGNYFLALKLWKAFKVLVLTKMLPVIFENFQYLKNQDYSVFDQFGNEIEINSHQQTEHKNT